MWQSYDSGGEHFFYLSLQQSDKVFEVLWLRELCVTACAAAASAADCVAKLAKCWPKYSN